MPAVATAQKYRAVFERTEKTKVDGTEKVGVLTLTDPEDVTFKRLVADGKDGYVRVTDAVTGEKIHGIHTSARSAQDLMRGCLKGTYNPFPKVRNKKREIS